MGLSFCSFNINNLYSRYPFGKKILAHKAAKSRAGTPVPAHLPGADPRMFPMLSPAKRRLAALSLAGKEGAYPDIICLQEVEGLPALRKFNKKYLGALYTSALLIESHDARQIHTGVLSRLPLRSVRSHLDVADSKPVDPELPFLFPRDCLEIEVAEGSGRGERLTLFACHFKSGFEKNESSAARADAFRQRQAEGVVAILRDRFPGPKFDTALFAVIGDLNDHPDSESIRPLTRESGLVDALERIARPHDRWTYLFRKKNTVLPFDHILLSPRLDELSRESRPFIERRGIGFRRYVKKKLQGPKRVYFPRSGGGEPERIDFQFERFADVTPKVQASDHCPVFFSW
jgi:endonuclease/exonuclease/phosphatase family metal-dependent hydrolase